MNTTAKTIVHVIDDEAEVRKSLAELIDSVGFSTCTHPSAEAFLAAYDSSTFGCLIIDVCLPGMSGLFLQRTLNDRKLSIPLIFLTGHGDVPMAVEAMSHGAYSFLGKPFRTHELLELIKNAIRDDYSRRRHEHRRLEVAPRFQKLTPRENEVLELLTNGAANKQVARKLAISERTVETHRARLMEKLEADSLAELISMVLQHRAIADPRPSRFFHSRES